MPFKAINANTGEPIISLNYNSKLELIALYENVVCPYCNRQMHCRERTNFTLHFVHNTTSKDCPSGGEGWMHLEGKRQVYLKLKAKIQSLPKNIKEHFKVDLECRVEQGKRIIDVALLLRNKPVEAHEIQISPISIPELEARTEDYKSQGIAAYWYFGEKSLTKEIERWSKGKFGEVRFFEFTKN